MSTTYYLLRKKGSAQGDGPYFGASVNAEPDWVSAPPAARRFATLGEAEQCVAEHAAQFGGFEIEVRSLPDTPA
ncbi:MAG: hypothetical protein M3N23_08745 [Pseudomonadota bacterium]|nr:hypothetical protein [Pseudomonadota bacterium]